MSRYSGVPYLDFVKERIFEPLNMSSTSFSPSEASQPSSATLTHVWSFFGRRLPAWFDDEQAARGAGPAGVISNAVDIVGSVVNNLLISTNQTENRRNG